MASTTVHQHFLCHFCSTEFHDRSSLIAHFSHCHIENSTKSNVEKARLPRLNKSEHDILYMLKLHRLNDKLLPHKHKTNNTSHSQIPLSNGYYPSSKQSSFDDAACHTNNLRFENNEQTDQDISLSYLNNKSSCHLYKYSRREQKNFYASVKRARLKKQHILVRKSRPVSFIFDQHKPFFIHIPTQINCRQRLNTNANNSYPLIFDPNFNSLVKLTKHHFFVNYSSDMKHFFQLLHSIASQEFQIIVNSNDNQHQISYTAFSFIHILRQTMGDYSLNLQKTMKRNYFQSFQQQEIIPTKTRRYDQSVSSVIQIDDNHQATNRVPISSLVTMDKTNSVVPTDLIIIDHQQNENRTNIEPILSSSTPVIEEPDRKKNASPIFLKEEKIDHPQNDSNTPARIRIINGSNTKQSSSRKTNTTTKKLSSPMDKIDENCLIKTTRMSTRKNSLTIIKNSDITEIFPPYQTKPVILTFNELSKQWSTYNVFYRCHACSHEEFFLVLSRECLNLHISSRHGNMEENFKQRLSTFLNNKGRSLKIFQHFLKWQQPWSDKEIEQIFQLSNK